MNINIALNVLKKHYKARTLTELASHLKTKQSTISGWISRDALGALINTLIKENNEDALSCLFNVEDVSTQTIQTNYTTINNKTINKNILDILEIAQVIYSKNLSKEEDFINLIKNWVKHNV